MTKTHEKQLLALDENLVKIEKKLLILKLVTPTNIESERQKFIQKKGEYVPNFEYQDVSLDTEELLEKLENIEIPDIPLSYLFQKKKQEIHNKILFVKAFKSQDTAGMTEYSQKIFGDIIPENFDYAKKMLENSHLIKQEEDILFFEDIRDYLKKFNHIYNIKTRLIEREGTARFTMKGDQLILRTGASVGKRELRSVVAHEVEGHYLRKVNGRLSKFSIFSRGTAGYIETEEGIAIYNQSRFLTKHDRKTYSIFERYFFTQYTLKHSYRRLVKKLVEYYGDDYGGIFTYILRLKRGFKDPSKSGVFMKDVVYTNGYLAVSNYIDKG